MTYKSGIRYNLRNCVKSRSIFTFGFTVAERRKCGSLDNNTLSSPGYPGNYPSNMDCNYSVPIPRDMDLKITFHDLDVQKDTACR